MGWGLFNKNLGIKLIIPYSTTYTLFNYLFNSYLHIHRFILKGAPESENLPDSTAEAVEAATAPADEASPALENGEAAPAPTAAEEKKKKKVCQLLFY